MKPLMFSSDQYGRFDIHRDRQFGNTNIEISAKTIRHLCSQGGFTTVADPYGAYRYYLSRRMRDVKRWYKGDLFEFLVPADGYWKHKILLVKNKENGRVDNVIMRDLFDNISDRMSKDLSIYIVHDHAVSRANERIGELYKAPYGDTYRWFLTKVKKWNPCQIKPKFAALALLNHNFKECEYYMDSEGHVYVVMDHTIVTVHSNEAERWELK